MRRYGHMRVRDLLSREGFAPGFCHAPLVAQFSSMGSINPKWLEELQHSFSQGSCTEPGQPARKEPCSVSKFQSSMAKPLLGCFYHRRVWDMVQTT
jgi:hypothetical protein